MAAGPHFPTRRTPREGQNGKDIVTFSDTQTSGRASLTEERNGVGSPIARRFGDWAGVEREQGVAD